jgi:hypothetical protein
LGWVEPKLHYAVVEGHHIFTVSDEYHALENAKINAAENAARFAQTKGGK